MDAPGTSLPTDVDSLQSLVGDLQSQLSNLQSALYNKEQQLVKLQEQLNLKQQRLYGKSTEKLSVEQLEWDFFNEAELLSALAQLAQEKMAASSATPRKRRGRQKKPFPKKLRRVEVVHDLSDEEKRCNCGQTLIHIGDDVTEQLAIIPQTYYLITHIRRKRSFRGVVDIQHQV